VASLRWVIRHRAWTPYHLVRYGRLLRRRRSGDVILEGLIFLGKDVELCARPGYGRIILGRWVHLGDGTKLRAHEGTLRIGDKVVFGGDTRVNCQLDIEIGAATMVADWVYVADFDHRFDELDLPIKDQGIVKRPVRIGPDVWLGTKCTVTGGVTIGQGSVVGAHAVVTRDVPPYSVVGGVPARVLRNRIDLYAAGAARRAAVADIGRKTARAAEELLGRGPSPSVLTPLHQPPLDEKHAAGATDASTKGADTSL
jgi:acetyltransferase-like isoleucine patch superfamily enzyme